MIKYADNAFLATKISFVNAIAALCEAVGADVSDVVLGMGYDKRIGLEFLRPGPGLGRLVLPEGHATRWSASPRTRATTSTCSRASSPSTTSSSSAWSRRSSRVVGGASTARRVAALGPHVQGPHRRPPRLAGARDHPPAACSGAPSSGRYDPAVAGHADRLDGIEVVADPYAACDGADGARRAHRVGRVPLARLRQGRRDHGAAARRRRPQPARPHRALSCAAGFSYQGIGSGLTMARVVVTGGAGFLGSHLCERAARPGRRGRRLDNLVTGAVDNIEHLFGTAGLHVRRARRQRATSGSPVASTRCCTSPARRRRSTTSSCPIQTLKVGSLGTHNTLGLAKAKGARFFLASTSEVYGDPQVHPQPETYWGNVNPVGPRGVYDEAKRFAEAMTMAYHRYHGLDVRIVRIFNTYGPRMRPDDGRVVSNFIVQALDGRAAHGLRRRHARPAASATSTTRCGASSRCSTPTEHGPVNIGNPNEFTMLELAELVLEVTGSASEIVFEPLPVDDPTQRRPDITLARELLGWEPQVQLREGLAAHRRVLPRPLTAGVGRGRRRSIQTPPSLSPLRVAVTLEQCWHRVPGGTASSALGTIGALRERDDIELHRRRRVPSLVAAGALDAHDRDRGICGCGVSCSTRAGTACGGPASSGPLDRSTSSMRPAWPSRPSRRRWR